MFSSYPCPQATKILGVFFVFRRTVLALHPSGGKVSVGIQIPLSLGSGRKRRVERLETRCNKSLKLM